MFTKGDLIVVFKAWSRTFDVGIFVKQNKKSIYYIPVGINTDYFIKNNFTNRVLYKKDKIWKIKEDNEQVDNKKVEQIRLYLCKTN